jgi:hypothetical protein
MLLVLENVEQTEAGVAVGKEGGSAAERFEAARRHRRNRGALPTHLRGSRPSSTLRIRTARAARARFTRWVKTSPSGSTSCRRSSRTGGAHPRALGHRERNPRAEPRRASRRAAGEILPNPRCVRTPATRKTRTHQPEEQTRRNHPLRAFAMGRPHALHWRRGHRDRLQHLERAIAPLHSIGRTLSSPTRTAEPKIGRSRFGGICWSYMGWRCRPM